MTNLFLFQKIKTLVAEERRIGIEILECLLEIERRKAYAELKYDGIFTYCVKELGFTEAQAFHRIQAMRALKETPEIKPLIEKGALSVSAVSKVQVELRREKKMGILSTKVEKLALFESLKHQTTKEVDQALAFRRGEKLKTKIVFELDEEAEALWNRIKNLSAHKTQGDPTLAFKMLMNQWIQKHDPERKEQRGSKTETRLLLTKVDAPVSTGRKAIPTALKLRVWKRDQGRCTACGSQHALQYDHKTPVAWQGPNTEANLRLLCRSCNLYRAIADFGVRAVKRE